MTTITCDFLGCKHNKNGKCSRNNLTIKLRTEYLLGVKLMRPECVDYDIKKE